MSANRPRGAPRSLTGRRSKREPCIVAISGPSGAGKTHLLVRLIPALARRGVSVAVVKHTRHAHAFDRPGKDTEVVRRAGALAAAIEGPGGMALFGPAAGGLDALVRLLPPVHLVLAEGFREAAVPRIEVHRRRVSREFLCSCDPRVFAIVTDEPPPRAISAFAAGEVGALADLVRARFVRAAGGGPSTLRARRGMSSVRAESGERTLALGRRDRMAKTSRKSGMGRGGRRTGTSRSAAGRKGGNATLRSRGPEFYSEIGRKGGRSRGASRRGGTSSRGTSRGRAAAGRKSSRRRAGR